MRKLLSLMLAIALLSLPALSLATEEEKVLNIFTWDTYFNQETILDPFTAETGIQINYATFSSNEEMLTKLQAVDGGEYDIILASDYVLDIARKAGLLQPLNKELLPNFENIGDAFLNQYFDPQSEYVVPYVAGSPLIVYDPAMVDVEIAGYEDLWNPALADTIVTVDDARQVIGITLMTLGYDFNSTDPAELAEAAEKLGTLAPNIHVLDYDSPHYQMISGESQVGYFFTPFIALTMMSRPDLELVFPEEGLGFGIDGVVVPVNAPHSENAHAFLDFLMRPEIGAAIAEQQLYMCVNEASLPFLSEEYLNNPALNIPAEQLTNTHFTMDVGEAAATYQDIWTAFKQQL